MAHTRETLLLIVILGVIGLSHVLLSLLVHAPTGHGFNFKSDCVLCLADKKVQSNGSIKTYYYGNHEDFCEDIVYLAPGLCILSYAAGYLAILITYIPEEQLIHLRFFNYTWTVPIAYLNTAMEVAVCTGVILSMAVTLQYMIKCEVFTPFTKADLEAYGIVPGSTGSTGTVHCRA